MLNEWSSAEMSNAAWDASVITELTAIDDAKRIPERIVLDTAILIGGMNDLRRDQFMCYCVETYVPNHNITYQTDNISLEEWSPVSELDVSTDESASVSDIED